MSIVGAGKRIPDWMELAAEEAWKKAQATLKSRTNATRFELYQANPLGFCHDVLNDHFTEDIEKVIISVRDNPVTIARSANAVGKCVAFGEILVDADGRARRVEEFLYPGDPRCNIFSFTEKDMGVATQEAIFIYNGQKECVEIVSETGKRVCRTLEHPLYVGRMEKISSHNQRRIIVPVGWKNAGNVTKEDFVLTVRKFPEIGKTVPGNVDEIKALAYMIGDGCSSCSCFYFTQADGTVLDEFKEIVERLGCVLEKEKDQHYSIRYYGRGGNQTICVNPLGNILRKYGIAGKKSADKFIPAAIWQLPLEQLAIFINRLYATDGWVHYGEPGKKAGVGSIEVGYCSVSFELVEALQRLLLRFGIVSRIRSKKTSWTHKGIKKHSSAYTLDIHTAEDVIEFYNKIGIYGEKNDKLKIAAEIAATKKNKIVWRTMGLEDTCYMWERVQRVENVGLRETVSINVEQDHTFLTHYVEHNSHVAARVGVWWFACFQDAKVYATSAPPLENLKKILWGQVLGIARTKESVFTGMRVKSLEIMRHAESFMTGVAIPLTGDAREREAKFSGKHSAHLLFIVDEGDAVPEEVYRGIESCMSGGMARLLVMFNPRDKSGPVYQMEAHGQANVVEISALRHPNVITGQDVIPGAVTRAKVIQRINEWTRPMIEGESPDEGTFIVPDFLVGTTTQAQDGRMYQPLPPGERVVTESAFWYMVLGKYPEQGVQQLISESWLTKARMRWDAYVAAHGDTPVGVKPIMGLDMAEYGGDYNVAAFRYGDFLGHFKFWAGMNVLETCDKAVELWQEKHPDAIMADGNGIGASVAPMVMRIAREKGISDMVIFGPKSSERPSTLIKCDLGEFPVLRDQLYWAVREWLKNTNAMLPPDEMLLEELRVVTYSVKGGKVKVMEKDQIRQRLKRSPDRSDALCLTFNPFEKVRWMYANEAKQF